MIIWLFNIVDIKVFKWEQEHQIEDSMEKRLGYCVTLKISEKRPSFFPIYVFWQSSQRKGGRSVSPVSGFDLTVFSHKIWHLKL